MKLKLKAVVLKPGTIIRWKEYKMLAKFWNKLIGKTLPYNRYAIIPEHTELLSIGDYTVEAYEPVRRYSKQESNRLYNIWDNSDKGDNWTDIKTIINIVRPNTFSDLMSIENCKYYKKKDLDAESDEYIY